MRVRRSTQARTSVLVIALVLRLATLLSLVATTLVDEPATLSTLAALLLLSVAVDAVWKWIRGRRGADTIQQTPTSTWAGSSRP